MTWGCLELAAGCSTDNSSWASVRMGSVSRVLAQITPGREMGWWVRLGLCVDTQCVGGVCVSTMQAVWGFSGGDECLREEGGRERESQRDLTAVRPAGEHLGFI